MTNKPASFTGLRSRQTFTIVDGNPITEAPGVVPRVRPAQAVNMKPSFSRSSLALLLLLSRTPVVGFCLPAIYCQCRLTQPTCTVFQMNLSSILGLTSGGGKEPPSSEQFVDEEEEPDEEQVSS